MGKKIDRFVLTSCMAIALYFYFEAAFENRLLAFLLALFCCIMILKALRRAWAWFDSTAWQQKRRLRRKSGGMLMQLACMEETEAQEHILRLLHAAYGWESPIVLELLHPSTQLSRERIFDAWRSHRDWDKLLVCSTGKCTSETRMFTSSLKSPKVAVVDADVLAQLLAEHPSECIAVQPTKSKRLLQLNAIAQLIFNRKNAPRGILFASSMLVMYVFSGSVYYLFAALFLLFAALVSFRRADRPAKLF